MIGISSRFEEIADGAFDELLCALGLGLLTIGPCCSVVPRARHCGIPAILPSLSLKNAPSAGLRAHLENLLIFSLFSTISLFSVT